MKQRWTSLKGTSGFRNLTVYLLFVAVAAVLWLVLAMNDSVQRPFDVRLRITDVPDTVTFINDPPASIHVNVRDRGTQLFRRAVINTPSVNVSFREFAGSGVFRLTNSELYAALRQTFGNSAQISGLSIDSLRLTYTTNPGKRVPIIVAADIETASGFVTGGRLKPSQGDALVYGDRNILDTLTRVFTNRIVRRDLAETVEVNVKLKPISGAKIVPSQIKVRIPVEPLVRKQSVVPVKVLDVPPGVSVLLFPANVEVSYFVPMSRFNDEDHDIHVVATYADILASSSGLVPLHLEVHSSDYVNPALGTTHVEFTIVR